MQVTLVERSIVIDGEFFIAFQKKQGRAPKGSAGAGASTATLDWPGMIKSSNKYLVVIPSSKEMVYDVVDEGEAGYGIGDAEVATKEREGEHAE